MSRTEIRVIELLAEGLDSTAVANTMFISPHTVRVHRKNILKKLDCSNMVEVIKKVMIDGLI
ncbi:response regulator transcription factor [Sphingobacterium spiritivorum]|uniref:response regulator transcription factor n=1 Tax=Sphingobacterium spiritivorum TaxID=258 RepID=UPI003DA2C280